MASRSAGTGLAAIAAMALVGRGCVTSGRSVAYDDGSGLSWRRIKLAQYTPDQDRKPRKKNGGARRRAHQKAVAWKGSQRRGC